MKTFQLNPAATELSVRIEIPMQRLEYMGWDFDTYYGNTAEAMLSGAMPLYTPTLADIEDQFEREQKALELAKEYCYNNYVPVIKIEGTPDAPITTYAWFNVNKNEDTQWEDTGDNAKTIEDIIELLNDGMITINDEKDYSVDADNTYVHAFVETEKEPA